MATLILGTVGTIFGGPLGGAIGSLIGSQFDRAIIGGPDREGPRLAEVSLQTSSYGTAIPQIFGDMRSAGSVIWATDLHEDSNREGGGKGRPSSVTFSYSANFAVALSSRPIADVGRIWADGNLLRGARGDFKTETLFRLYTGHEDQGLDPLMASAEGLNNTPAHRGIAYAVFENLQLADFGNRIPSLTFEILNGEGRLDIVNIANMLSHGLIKPQEGANGISIIGYAASQSISRSAIDNLIAPLPISLRAKDKALELVEASSEVVVLNASIAVSQNQERFEQSQIVSIPINEVPKNAALRYYDPMREYQAGLQSSRRPGPGQTSTTTDFAASIQANDARDIIYSMQLQNIFSRHSLSVTLTRANAGAASYQNKNLAFHSGDLVRFPNFPYVWKISQVEQDLGVVQLSLQAISMGGPPVMDATDAAAGRSNGSIDAQTGQTLLHILDLPALNENHAMSPNIAVAAAGTQAAWRKANLFERNGGNIKPLPNITAASAMGTALYALEPASAYLWDRHNKPEIALAHDMMVLPLNFGPLDFGSRDSASVSNGEAGAVYHAMIGQEIISFARAELLSNGHYILHDLCRGVGGTEAYINEHIDGERFVFLDNDQLQFLSTDNYQLGQSLTIEALGLGDEAPQSETIDDIGRSLRPLPPVHINVKRLGNGDAMVKWIRRGRIASRWSDGVDIPLGEDSEQYALLITAHVGLPEGLRSADLRSADLRSVGIVLVDEIVTEGQFTIASDQLSRWIADGQGDVVISAVQIGTYARSEPVLLRHRFS